MSNHEQNISDHFPLIICTRLQPRPNDPLVYDLNPPLSTALYKDHHKHKYQDDMEQFVCQLNTSSPNEAAKHLQTIAAYSSMICRKHHRRARQKKLNNWWSPEIGLIYLNLSFLRSIIYIITQAKCKQQPWYSLFLKALNEWTQFHSQHVQTYAIPDVHKYGSAPDTWKNINTLTVLESKLIIAFENCQRLSVLFRQQKFHQQLKSIAKKISKHLELNKLKPVISVTGSKRKGIVDLSYVVTNHDIIFDPIEVHKTCTQHFHAHHSLNPTVFPIAINWYTRQSVNESKPAFIDYCRTTLPPALYGTIDALWEGFTSPWTSVSDSECSRRLQSASSILSECPSLSEFTNAISRSPSSSPGVSGLSFSHIKLWSPTTVQKVHQYLCLLWNNHHLIPDHWHWKLLCPIPKADKDPQVLDNLRPIMLVECLRKLWVGIVIHRLSTFLTKENFLSASQHGYVCHRSTVTSGLQLLDCLDDFSENRIATFLSSWDFTKAFDSLPFSLSRLALMRSFVPSDIMEWLLHLDMDGRIIVRTPYALDCIRKNQLCKFQQFSDSVTHAYFKASGGVAQGDVHSPYIWRLFIDILLCALESIRPTLLQFPTIDTSDFGYADDIISLASSLVDLQKKADIVSSFSIITGISISWSKLRATYQEYDTVSENPTLTVWDKSGVAHSVRLVREQTIRHLGFQVSTTGNSVDALSSTSAKLQSCASLLLRRTKWLPSEAVLKTTALQTVAQTVYTTQLSTYTAKQLQSLDGTLFKIYRQALHHWPTFPGVMLQLPHRYCGLGLPSISLSTYLAKFRILQRSLHSNTLGDSLILRYLRYFGINPTLHYDCTVPPPSSRIGSASGYWLDNLLQHCHDCDLILRRGGNTFDLTSEAQLVDLYPEYSSYWIKNGLGCLGDIYNYRKNSWIKLPDFSPSSTFTLPPTRTVSMSNYLRVGQCWRPNPSSNIVYEILSIYSNNEIHTRVWEYLPRPYTIQLSSHHLGPITYDSLFSNSTSSIRVYTYGDRRIHFGTTTRRTIWSQLTQSPPLISPSTDCIIITNILHQIQSHFASQPIKIYTDGSWKSTASCKDRALLFPNSSIGGCSLVVMLDSPHWKQHRILVYSIIDDGASPTEHAYSWEIFALSIASILQSRYESACKLYSDCQSAIHTITKLTPTNALLDQHSVLLYPISKLPTRPTVHHIAAHPEIHVRNTREWTQDEHGIYLADVAASNYQSLHRIPNVDLSLSSYNSSQLLNDFMRIGTWTWCYKSNIPILLPIKSIWMQKLFTTYVQNRDNSHQVGDENFISWSQRSWFLTSRVHHFSSIPTPKRARLQRILLHWSGIGANISRNNVHSADASCPFCNVPETETHLLAHCNDPLIIAIKNSSILEAAADFRNSARANPHLTFMSNLHASLHSHAHGYLLYLGFITSNLSSSLPVINMSDQLVQQLLKIVISYLRILSNAGIIIDYARSRRHQSTPNASQASTSSNNADSTSISNSTFSTFEKFSPSPTPATLRSSSCHSNKRMRMSPLINSKSSQASSIVQSLKPITSFFQKMGVIPNINLTANPVSSDPGISNILSTSEIMVSTTSNSSPIDSVASPQSCLPSQHFEVSCALVNSQPSISESISSIPSNSMNTQSINAIPESTSLCISAEISATNTSLSSKDRYFQPLHFHSPRQIPAPSNSTTLSTTSELSNNMSIQSGKKRKGPENSISSTPISAPTITFTPSNRRISDSRTPSKKRSKHSHTSSNRVITDFFSISSVPSVSAPKPVHDYHSKYPS